LLGRKLTTFRPNCCWFLEGWYWIVEHWIYCYHHTGHLVER